MENCQKGRPIHRLDRHGCPAVSGTPYIVKPEDGSLLWTLTAVLSLTQFACDCIETACWGVESWLLQATKPNNLRHMISQKRHCQLCHLPESKQPTIQMWGEEVQKVATFATKIEPCLSKKCWVLTIFAEDVLEIIQKPDKTNGGALCMSPFASLTASRMSNKHKQTTWKTCFKGFWWSKEFQRFNPGSLASRHYDHRRAQCERTWNSKKVKYVKMNEDSKDFPLGQTVRYFCTWFGSNAQTQLAE